MFECFFFFKQKTAYEVRISDWSSDVCSSDLREEDDGGELAGARGGRQRQAGHLVAGGDRVPADDEAAGEGIARRRGFQRLGLGEGGRGAVLGQRRHHLLAILKSEEHTSELQSLMRISYAVFCLKKTKVKECKNHTKQ